jgi:hypothetical protein
MAGRDPTPASSLEHLSVGVRTAPKRPGGWRQGWFTASIYDHGKLHWTKRYYSNYPAVDGVTIVGTKT